MAALFAIVWASAKDCAFRGAVIATFCLGVLVMIATRFTAIYGFGEEVSLLLEFGLSNLVVGGALLAVLCAIPVRKAGRVLAADRVLVTRSLSPSMLYVGRWLGSCVVIALVHVLWSLALIGALAWFASAEPTIFSLVRDTTLGAEVERFALASSVIVLQSFLLAALAVACAVRGSMLAPILSVLALLVLGILLPDMAAREGSSVVVRGLAWLVPDLRAASVTETLYGAGFGFERFISLFLQTIGYGVLAAMLGARLVLRR